MISTQFASDLLKLLFSGTAIPGIADNAASGANTDLYLSLHTADPGAAGGQDSSEVSYVGYARVAVARASSGFTITGAVMTPTAAVEFGEMTGGSTQTVTHMCIGTHATGAGKVLFRFALDQALQCEVNTIPRLRQTTSLTAVTA